MDELVSRLKRKPVIAGVKSVTDVQAAVGAGVGVIFWIAGTLFDVMEVKRLKFTSRPLVFAHVDLLQGIGKDQVGMRFLAQEGGLDGILTTRAHLVKAAKNEGLMAIQRIFLLDSEALKTGVQVVRSTRPHAVEILPGPVLPYIAHRLPFDELPPVIAGGLLDTAEEVKAVLKTSAVAVSTSKRALW